MSSTVAKPRVGRAVAVVAICLANSVPALASQPVLPPDVQAKRLGAFAAGLQYLLTTQGPEGTWAEGNNPHKVGYAALPGLVLLQGGVSGHHPVIRQAAAHVLRASPKMENTYEIALSILFLDRLIWSEEGAGRRTEQGELYRRVLKVLTVRLIAGQTLTGGWGYSCKVLTPAEQARLYKELRRKHIHYVTAAPSKDGWAVLHNPALLMEAPKPRRRGRKIVPPEPPKPDLTSDNSVTQSAILALFAARHYHMPVERSFRLITKRFKTSQNADGSWGYHYLRGGGDPGKDTMTPAGLLGLALEYGLEDDDAPIRFTPTPAGLADLTFALAQPTWTTVLPALATAQRPATAVLPTDKRASDQAIARGLVALARYVGQPAGRTENLPQPNLYFLWCLQRMGALYDLPTIGDKDWYRWGTEALLANQNVKGFWQNGGYPSTNPVIDTCFALLFLKQRDLIRQVVDKLDEDPNGLAKLARVEHPRPPAPRVVRAAPPAPRIKAPAPPPTRQAPKSEPQNRTVRRSRKSPATIVPAEEPAPEEQASSGKLWLGIGLGGTAALLLAAGGLVLLLNRQPAAAPVTRRKPRGKRNGEPARRSRNGRSDAPGPRKKELKKRRPLADEETD